MLEQPPVENQEAPRAPMVRRENDLDVSRNTNTQYSSEENEYTDMRIYQFDEMTNNRYPRFVEILRNL